MTVAPFNHPAASTADSALVDNVRSALERSLDETTIAWPLLLERVAERARAREVVVADPDGLAMASRGDIPRDWVDSLAAHGRLLWEVAERAWPGLVRSVSVQYPSRWVTIIGATSFGGNSATMIVSGREPAEAALGVPNFGHSTRWTHFLRWCTAPAESFGALAVDGQGLLVDSVGNLDRDDAESIGAHLVVLAERADRVDFLGGPPRMLAVRFERRWLTGMRTPRARNRTALVGVIGTRPPGPGAVADMKRALRALTAAN